jgi:DNA-binding NtrC family response regulator
MMQKVRAQVAAAAASGANTLIFGARGSGRGHVARAIHYGLAKDSGTKLIPVDCDVLSDELLRRALEGVRGSNSEGRPTLLLENLDRLTPAHQALLAPVVSQKSFAARIIATYADTQPSLSAEAAYTENGEPVAPVPFDSALLHAISTITIRLPRLADRLEDLPLLAHYFLEACNHGSVKQVGSLRSDALDLLGLYTWPGELDQLQEIISAAHRSSKTRAIVPSDLPPILQHAFLAAKRLRREPERIVLDDLLATIEKEAIVRALAQAGGNKSEGASLLGMTRPRLYRRLVQLGLVAEEEAAEQEQPEFIERDPTE